MSLERTYRGRLAPSPTGFLHLGHARTFWIAAERARQAAGVLVLRNEDLDPQRSKPEYVTAMYEDLRWLGLEWQEGPDLAAQPGGGPFGPYSQSDRRSFYRDAWRKLRDAGAIYPCTCSRKDLARAAQAPHDDADELPYPGTCRERPWRLEDFPEPSAVSHPPSGKPVSWRFRVPDGERVRFDDALAGPQEYVAGRDFGDFLVWRRDDVPAYQLACVADDAAMRITEVVRGADLLKSTARQLLLYKALGLEPPAWAHAALVTDEHGVRLAKRHDALSLRALRAAGKTPAQVREMFPRGM
jgi:glutamyl-tRNA synthetase